MVRIPAAVRGGTFFSDARIVASLLQGRRRAIPSPRDYLFDKIAGLPVGRGIVRRANSYFPISTHRLSVLRRRYGADFLCDALAWRSNLQTLRDYLGIPWLDDFVWRSGRWTVNLDSMHETGVASLANRARRELASGGEGPAFHELRRRTAQACRILLTRARQGIYVWIMDAETRDHLRASLIL